MEGQAQDNGTGALLTVDDAASAFEAILSAEEDTETLEAPTAEEHDEDVDAAEDEDDSEETEPSEESDESDEDEESEDSDDEAESDDEDDDTSAPRTVKVKVNGEELEVTEDELIRGYSRTADYTRKTQELATERNAVREERQRYAAGLAQLQTILNEQAPEEPDWVALREEDPAEYAATWALWQQYREREAAVAAEQRQVQEKIARDRAAQMEQLLAEERTKLLSAIPSWQKPEVAAKEKAELIAFAKASGYTDEELNGVVDHRVMVLLRKAWLHDKAQQQRPSVREKIERVKTAAPGPSKASKASRTKAKAVQSARQRLAKSGSVADAAALFMEVLDD